MSLNEILPLLIPLVIVQLALIIIGLLSRTLMPLLRRLRRRVARPHPPRVHQPAEALR